jgi:ACS family tartrate transporter-like MFS transporter
MADPQIATAGEEAIGASALKKATWRLIPLIGLGYGIAYIDRVNISFASLQMNRDLHFSATVYGLGAGIFFLSYAVCEIPSNLLLYRFGARRWLSRIMITWGLIAMSMMFVRTPLHFYIVRFLLGIAEAGFFPGIVYYLMQWFPPGLRARTISRFYISYPLSTVIMGAVAGWLLGLQGQLGLAGWQWLFLVEGLPAVLLGFVFLRLLPDSPHDAAWLTQPERSWILKQIEDDAKGAEHSHNILSALRDRRVLQIGLFALCMQFTMYAYQFSAPSIIQTLTHLNTTYVGYITAGMGLFGAIGMLWNAVLSDRANERYLHIAAPFLLIFVGFLVGGLTTGIIVSMVALTTVVFGNSALQPPYLSLAPQFLKGKSAAAGIAAINMIGIFGGFLGPFWMGLIKDHKGTDQLAMLTLTVPSFFAIALMLLMRRESLRQAVLKDA